MQGSRYGVHLVVSSLQGHSEARAQHQHAVACCRFKAFVWTVRAGKDSSLAASDRRYFLKLLDMRVCNERDMQPSTAG